MKLNEISYKSRNRAQVKVEEWKSAFPHLTVTLDFNSDAGRFRIHVENPKTGRAGFLKSGTV